MYFATFEDLVVLFLTWALACCLSVVLLLGRLGKFCIWQREFKFIESSWVSEAYSFVGVIGNVTRGCLHQGGVHLWGRGVPISCLS